MIFIPLIALLVVGLVVIFWPPSKRRMTPEAFAWTLCQMFRKEIVDREMVVHLCEDDLIVRVRGESVRWPKSSLYGAIGDLAGARALEVYDMLKRSRTRT